jgi:TonB-linked SusC/RagA family outer membrane protein
MCAALLWAFPAQAQTGEVSGRVVDETTGQPIEGAQVVVVGTNIRGQSRVDGLYNLVNVPVGSRQVRVMIVGHATQTATLTIQPGVTVTLDFTLSRAVISLDAMVVTGQAGAVSRREIGNSVSTIGAEQIANLPIRDVGQALQGLAAGVTVMDNSGQVGVGQRIRLRGINSVTMGNQPLIYVDGVRILDRALNDDPETGNLAPSPLHDINPEDIERVEVVKGAAATTLYGTEASAGVIQIFTRRGSSGAPRWSISIDQGFNSQGHVGPPKDINPTGLGMNNCNFTGIAGDPEFATGDWMFPADTLGCPQSGSWFQNGWMQRYNVSVRGGREDINYFISARWGSEDGTVNPQNSTDYSVRANLGFSLGPTMTLQFNNNYARRDNTWIPDGDNAEGFALNVWRGPNGYTPNNDDSQVFDLSLKQLSNHYTTGLTLNWNPLPSMTHRVTAGIDFVESDYREFRPWGFYYDVLGDREDDEWQRRTLTLDYSGTWSTRLTEGVGSSFSVGAQMYDEYRYGLNGFGYEWAGPGEFLVDNAARTEAFESRSTVTNGGFFFNEVLSFADRIFLTGGIRFDGFSTFGENYGLAAYPKLSLAYTISDEGFWPSWWEGMKLRAAWGESGRAPGNFDAIRTWDPVSGDEGQPAVTPATVGNPDLGPERSRELEFGFEGSMFNGRVGFDVTRYLQKTYDALIAVQQVPSNGFIGTQLENVGELRNSGWELQLNADVIRNPTFGWNVGVRYSTQKSQVWDLGGFEDIYVSWRQNLRPCTSAGTNGARILSEEALRQLVHQGRYSDEGAVDRADLGLLKYVECPIPGYWHDVIVNDTATAENPWGTTAAGVRPEMEERYLGPTYPKQTLGVNMQFSVGRWLTIDAVGESQLGHVLSAGPAYQNARRQVWPECREVQALYNEVRAASGTTAARDALNAYELAKCISGFTTYGMWIDGADFFKLRSVSLSFRLPNSIIPGSRSAILQLQGRNLFRITDYVGVDPEVSEQGSQDSLWRQEYYNLPTHRSFIASLRLEF